VEDGSEGEKWGWRREMGVEAINGSGEEEAKEESREDSKNRTEWR
jgi:hypothetical protein